MELWELFAREGIRDLVARYNSNGDTGRFGPEWERCDDASDMLSRRMCNVHAPAGHATTRYTRRPG